tara:strand:+ start:2348 stop:2647 length:300 start_codon:yes stop_codon:yes gene_type:complete
MKAELEELNGKYYGTIVNISDGEVETSITIWDSGTFIPSDRELESHGFTRDEWENDVETDDGWGGKTTVRKLDIVCDSHFESRWTHEFAQKLVDSINNF